MNRWLPRCRECRTADAVWGLYCDECRTRMILRVVLPPRSPHENKERVISELRSPWFGPAKRQDD